MQPSQPRIIMVEVFVQSVQDYEYFVCAIGGKYHALDASARGVWAGKQLFVKIKKVGNIACIGSGSQKVAGSDRQYWKWRAVLAAKSSLCSQKQSKAAGGKIPNHVEVAKAVVCSLRQSCIVSKSWLCLLWFSRASPNIYIFG